MRLKALYHGTAFARVLTAVQRVAKVGYLILSPERVLVTAFAGAASGPTLDGTSQGHQGLGSAARLRSSDDDVTVWAEMHAGVLFAELLIASRDDNRIGLKVDLSLLAKALHGADRAEQVIVRLSKKGAQPYLTFELHMEGQQTVVAEHHVPVCLCSPQEVNAYTQPVKGDGALRVAIPGVRPLAKIVDRMKTVGRVLAIDAVMESHNTATLRLRLETHLVYIQSQLTGLRVFDGVPADHDNVDGRPVVALHADVRKITRMLPAHLSSAGHSVQLWLRAGHSVALSVQIGSGCELVYACPASVNDGFVQA